MLKRLLDVLLSLTGLLLLAPVLLLGMLAVWLTSPGPVFYRARRVGRYGRPFTMHKLRTMHLRRQDGDSAITGARDPRVFPVGALLRKTKIDELPQLWDVLRGEMSIVGPRPEDPDLVARFYGPDGWETLQVRPGLSSPGSLFYYLYSDAFLEGPNPEEAYGRELLPRKLALDLAYIRRSSVWADFGIILQTVGVILWIALGRPAFRGKRMKPCPPADMKSDC